MTDPNDEPQNPSVNADNNSIAVGSISASGDISGNIHIGNVYQTPEDDLPLSSDEIENGLTGFAQYLPERAPVLQDSFSSIARKLRATLGADQNSLSPALKAQREDGVDRMKLMCMEVTDISFRAICLGQNPPPYDSRPPFLGLFAFRPEDREFFFGRDALVQKLVARIKAHPFLAVLGASGSGKSSLVMAGLVPALEAQMSYLTPSSAPLSQLLTAKESASVKTVFVIDQFEELFTHPHDAAERADFIHALLELTKTNRVVITMRADFWGEVAIYADLKQAMQEHQELIAPMNVDELHSAMEQQAAVVGLRFDPTLSESILAEVKGEPGAMPLLQHALWELWNRRHGLWIKAEEYQAFGGVKQAIASTAEEVYASCSDFERARVRDIFLRLTRLDESGEGRDTRRRVLIEELIPVNSDSSVTIKLLNKLADARLIVKTEKDVEVAHEALIRHWSRLTEWLNEDRDNLRLREGVSESTREWENSKRDDSLLNHRGGRLELALAMSKLPRYQLNPFEQAYLDACTKLRIKEQRERERRLRFTVIASIAAAIIFLILGSFGLVKSNEATSQAATAQAASTLAFDNAATSQANANAAATAQAKAEEQAKISFARQLASQAQLLMDRKSQVAVPLAIQSMRLFPISETTQILQGNPFGRPIAHMTHDDIVSVVVFNPDGKYVVSGSADGTARVWESGTGNEIARMTHDGGVSAVAFSPDGKYVVSGSYDKTARVWSTETGQEVARMTNDDYVSAVAFSPDGKYVVSSGCDKKDAGDSCVQGSARVWSVETGQEVARMTHDGRVNIVAFSPDGKYVVSGGWDKTARVWSAETGQEVARMTHDGGVSAVAFSPDGKYVVSSGCDKLNVFFECALGSARVWSAETGQEVARMTHDGGVSAVAFSSDGKYVVSGSWDKTARVWSAETGQEVARMTHDGWVNTVAFSPDGKYVVSGSWDNTARVWLAETGQEVARMTHDDRVTAVAFSSDGKYVVSGSDDKTAQVWSVETGQEVARMTHNWNVTAVAFSPDGKYVVSGSDDKTARVWSVETGQEVARMTYDGNASVAFSPDGKYVVSATGNTALVWSAKTGQEVARMTHDGNASVAFSPDGKYVVSVAGSTALVWSAETGQEVARMTHGDFVSAVVFSPDGKYVVSGSWDKTARVWSLETGQEVARMTHNMTVTAVAFSPDGKYVVSGSNDGTVRVWLAKTGQESALMWHDSNVSSVAFSPDGKYVVSGSYDKTARVWEVETGQEVTRMIHDSNVFVVAFSPDGKYVISAAGNTALVWSAKTGQEVARMTHYGGVSAVAFSPDGKYVVSSGCDKRDAGEDCVQGSARVWMWRPEDLIAIACLHVPRNLTRAEWTQYIGDALPYQAACPNLPIEAESTPMP